MRDGNAAAAVVLSRVAQPPQNKDLNALFSLLPSCKFNTQVFSVSHYMPLNTQFITEKHGNHAEKLQIQIKIDMLQFFFSCFAKLSGEFLQAPVVGCQPQEQA